jgi:hypothetical protein
MSSSPPSEQRPASSRRVESPPRESPLVIRSKESEAFSQTGAIVLGSGIPAFEEDSIYIPTGAKNELTYTTVQAWC